MFSVLVGAAVALTRMKGGSAIPDCVQQSHGSFQRLEDMKMNEYNNPISHKETGEAAPIHQVHSTQLISKVPSEAIRQQFFSRCMASLYVIICNGMKKVTV